MGLLSLVSALLALGAVALFGIGKFLAIGAGIAAIGLGIRARRVGRGRIAATLGLALGGIAALLGTTKVALTLAAISLLERL